MSYSDCMAAFNLEMPDKVPRTEYSAETHWDLVKAVTGIDVSYKSPWETKNAAQLAFYRAWDYGFLWSTMVDGSYMKGRRTSMGHGVYAVGGTDFNDRVSCPFKDPEEVLAFDPEEEYGKIDIAEMTEKFSAHYAAGVKRIPDVVVMTGIYITCMSGLIEMFGWEMLLSAAGLDPEGFGELTNRYCSWISQHFAALARCSAPVVMVHDDIVWTSGAFIHPEWYRRYVFPNYKKLFAPLRESGKKIIFTSDGDYTAFVDDIAACGVSGFVLEPMTDMGYIAEKYGKTHFFVGNADTRVLLRGDKGDIYAEVKRCMDIGKRCPGFIMAVGNHIPPNTPVESALWYNEAFEKLRKR